MYRPGALVLAVSLAAPAIGHADAPASARRVTARNATPQPGALQISATSLALGNVFFAGTSSTGAGLYASEAGSGRSRLIAEVSAGPIVELGGRGFFIGSRAGDAPGLWTTDGSAAGARLLRAIGLSSNLSTSTITVAGGRLYFLGEHETLWTSDGTADGTLALGAAGALGPDRSEMIPFGDRLLFLETDAVSNRIGLWESRGTASTTSRVEDLGALVDPQEGFSRSPYGLSIVGGRAVFFVPEREAFRMWASDGTAAGTVVVRDFVPDGPLFCPGSCVPFGPSRPVDGLFFANDGTHGREPWRTDGTAAGTRLVRDIAPGTASSDDFGASYGNPGYISPAVGSVQLLAADDQVHGQELWRTDGTEAGTSLVADIVPGPGGPNIGALTSGGGFFFFRASGNVWRSDGTAAGTQTFGGLQGVPSALGPGVSIAATNGLWRSDGASLELVDDGARSPGLRVVDPTAAGGRVFFTDPDRRTLWASDGTDSGTEPLHDFTTIGPLWSAGRRVYFTPEEALTVTDPWQSDGTEAGTVPVAGFVGNSAAEFTAAGGRIFYTAADDAHGFELWTIDGDGGGGAQAPRLVADLAPGPDSSSPYQLAALGRSLLFARGDRVGGAGGGLWRTDGTESGTTLILPMRVEQILPAGDRLFVIGSDEISYGLWMSDGTTAGTRLMIRGALAFNATASGRNLYFALPGDGFPAIQLWFSDGTPEGTRLVRLFAELYALSPARDGAAFVAANDGVHGRELWRSDGTDEGTTLVKDILPGGDSSEPRSMLSVDGMLFFSAIDGEHGRELWRSDGTPEGTVLLQDIAPGLASSVPQGLTRVGNVVYFEATDDAGPQLWALSLEAPRSRSAVPRGATPRTVSPRD
ncbi:MAG TPA: ELWxxDGT repeat protein [Thermoanaerobaculia bacterium]